MITMDIGGVGEISDALDVSRSTVSMWANRRESTGFPEPIKVLRMGPVYDMDKVRAWHAATREPITEVPA